MPPEELLASPRVLEYLCRDNNIARFFKRYAERDGPIGEIVRRETTLPVLTIRLATEPTPGTDRGDEMSPALKGTR